MRKIGKALKNLHQERDRVLFNVGLIGLALYVFGPSISHQLDTLRAPELIPVYTIFLGGSSVAREKKRRKTKEETDDSSK